MACIVRQAHTTLTAGVDNFSSALAAFEEITLEELKNSDAQLMSRREKKFLMTFQQCASLVSDLTRSYRALEIEDTRIGRYETMYYDTGSFMIYLQHHNGKANRFKLRFRHYCSTDETYLEVKERQNTGRTVKIRMETDGIPELSEKGPKSFLKSSFPYDSSEFHPVLTTEYSRVTLVSKDFRERITFDLCPSFCQDGTTYSYPGVVVGEIKYDRSLFQSPGLNALRKMGIRKTSFSKYCIGVSLLYNGQKHNRFKQLQLRLKTLSMVGSIAC
ncbi:MAG: polyphosphate polymerase domain-containing protein [Methanomicrobiales archaeon]